MRIAAAGFTVLVQKKKKGQHSRREENASEAVKVKGRDREGLNKRWRINGALLYTKNTADSCLGKSLERSGPCQQLQPLTRVAFIFSQQSSTPHQVHQRLEDTRRAVKHTSRHNRNALSVKTGQ
jgi:hypothetical protein